MGIEPDPPQDPNEEPVEPIHHEESEPEEDFAAMLEASLQPESLSKGDLVEGTVVAMDSEVAFVDFGGKGEATLDLAELLDEDGDLDVQVGDRVKAVVVSTSGGVKLSNKLARQAANREALREAFSTGLPVEGRVEKVIKGGFEIRFSGERAFCPISQIDTQYTDEPEAHAGRTYEFRVIEYAQDGKNIVVSRRAILNERAEVEAEQVRKQLEPGAVMTGRVVSIQKYGAFVDLGGGVQGLLHVSEMGWSRISDPSNVVQPNDEITVKVLNIDEAKGRIALGLKQLQADPWSSVAETFRIGQTLAGTITRKADFGAFVELAPGIEALAHVSTFPPTGKSDGWKASVPDGGNVVVEILSIDTEAKRIGVALVEEGTSRAEGARGVSGSARMDVGARLTGKVKSHEHYGVFVFLGPGKTGLIAREETGLDEGADASAAFPVGSEIEVVVLEADPEGRRIRLSAREVAKARERDEVDSYAARQSSSSASFGSLADQLRAAMSEGAPPSKRPKGSK